MVKDTIDRDPKYVFHNLNVQSILLWLFQFQDDPKIQKWPQNKQMLSCPKIIQKSVQGPQMTQNLVGS